MSKLVVNAFFDSESGISVGNFAQTLGGLGNWPELVAQDLSHIPGVGPLLSPGIRGVWLGLMPLFPTEWTYSGSWSTVTKNDAFDKLPFGAGDGTHGYGKYGSGSSLVATWTKPTSWAPVTCFDFWWIDMASGGEISYRVDGGSWINAGQTRTGNNKVSVFFVNTPITSTFEVRMADASGTAGLGFPGAITPYHADPRSATSGVILNVIAANGATLRGSFGSVSGDRTAIFHDVQLGTGNPIGITADANIVGFVNDIALGNGSGTSAAATQYGTDLANLAAVLGAGQLIIFGTWQIETADYDAAQQDFFRKQVPYTAASLGARVIDFNQLWTNLGLPDLATQGAAYLLNTDNLHLNQAGHFAVAAPVFSTLRSLFIHAPNSGAYAIGGSGLGGPNGFGGLPATVLGGRATESNTARAGTRRAQVTGGRASEIDAARTGSPRVTAAGNRANETDAARSGIPSARVSGARAAETDTGRAGTPKNTLVGARATETDAARAGSPFVSVTGTRALETDTARAGIVHISFAAGRATETDLARSGSPYISVTGGRALETDTARAGSPTSRATGGRATETDQAFAGTPSQADSGTNIGHRATETDLARAGSPRAAITGSRASEIDAARSGQLSVALVGSRATELDIARAGFPHVLVTGGRALEHDTARAGTPVVIGAPDRNLDVRFGQPPTRWTFTQPAARWSFEGAEA